MLLVMQPLFKVVGIRKPRLRQREKTFPGGRSTVIDLHIHEKSACDARTRFCDDFVKNKSISASLRRFLCRELSAGVVDSVGRGQNELGDGEDGVAVVDEAGEDSGQRLRRVEGGVVEQHDAARLYLGGHPPADGVRVVILPIEGVPIGKDLKPLRRKGLLVLPLCALGKNLTCK